ncbi:gamma-glutamyltransferase family protein [Novosphingobium mangrovi (ex Huang et al. 2023)]|uniref:Gamma-glutamyltransferase family protein n=1 Tax=Novosphingobium mangrovi (ex Huang et al. 2023) TaxID=2976432 RepID=A0ABT2I0Z5_9SPHN|nr:gamma-glutamyltransferase family protein [Novosphingobium mangrovi (ex Huang et al. 2023)]MCT2398469.1 gamma-glutamyltransferase family protein [Novosphingobium mangrovi (ex Huang et al. 2023)]
MPKADGSSAQKAARWRGTGAEAIMAEQCQARGVWGICGAAAPGAARIGAGVLDRGGNAYDAAVAAALAETVLLPPKCGLGGDLIAIVWPAGAEEPECLIAVGGAPAGLAEAARAGQLDDTGPFSVGVPAAPHGYAALAERGRLGLEALAEPAIALARRGIAWARICAVLSDESRDLVLGLNPQGTSYYPGGRGLEPGETIALPGMARLMERFAEYGAALYESDVGSHVVERVREAGGVLTAADFAYARAEWIAPARAASAGLALFATPAPTHGASLLEAVSRLGAADGQVAGYDAALEAIARRRDTLSDPSGTSMVSAVDAEETMVVIVHSNSYPRFGSGLIVEPYQLILANRAGRGFSATPGHPNFPAAGKRPATTLHAWGVLCDDGSRMLGATPGGTNQMPWNVATLGRILNGQRDAGHLIVAPRWEWRPSDDGVLLEAGFDEATREAFRDRAPSFAEVDRWAMRSAMQIVTRSPDGVATIAADPRTVGTALAL